MKRTGKRFFANFTVASSHELPPRWPGRVSVLPTDNDDDDLSSGRSYGFSPTHTIPLLQNPVRMSHYSFGEYIHQGYKYIHSVCELDGVDGGEGSVL